MVEKGRKKGTLRFAVQCANGTQRAELAGDFNNWQPRPMRKNRKGQFVAVVPVQPGSYEYKFLLDGEWKPDPDNSTSLMNEYGTMNSIAVAG